MTAGKTKSVSAINSAVFTCRVSLVAKPKFETPHPHAKQSALYAAGCCIDILRELQQPVDRAAAELIVNGEIAP
jgi:hypothetical protein